MSTDFPIESYDPGPTREELFARLQNPDEADEARDEILTMYYPFMHGAVHRISIPRRYHEQVISDVVESLARYLKRFRYNKKAGRFRDYVKRCLKNAHLKRADYEGRQAKSGFDPDFLMPRRPWTRCWITPWKTKCATPKSVEPSSKPWLGLTQTIRP